MTKVPQPLTISAIIVLAIAAWYAASRLIDLAVPRLARLLSWLGERSHTDSEMAMRRAETMLGIGAAITRVALAGLVLYSAWRAIMPSTAGIALISASAFLAIVAGSMLTPILRDVTLGTMMIAERWYNVGDHVVVEPFLGVSGVVEQVTPRSTKLRSLTGEAIWLHNQSIAGVRVTARGVRTMALDVFVNDPEAGKKAIQKAIRTLPTGPTMLARQLHIDDSEQLGDGLWRITAVGQTAPGREWLIEDFALKAINKYGGNSIVHGPIARYADATAERRFRRSVHARA